MVRKNKLDKILWETYEILYAESTPKADFNELVENAKVNEEGRKEIDFMSYSINGDRYDEIVENQMKKYKLKPHERNVFKIQAYLGCGPKSTR